MAKCNKTGTMNLFSMEVGWGGDCFRQDCLASLIAYCTIHNLEWYAITNITSINPLFWFAFFSSKRNDWHGSHYHWSVSKRKDETGESGINNPQHNYGEDATWRTLNAVAGGALLNYSLFKTTITFLISLMCFCIFCSYLKSWRSKVLAAKRTLMM